MWDNHKSCYIIYPNFRDDLKTQIREIIDFYTASAKDLNPDLIKKVRKICSEFLNLINSSDSNWFQTIQNDGDNLCNKFRDITQNL